MPNFSLGKGWLTKTGGDLNTGGDLLWRLGAKRENLFIYLYIGKRNFQDGKL